MKHIKKYFVKKVNLRLVKIKNLKKLAGDFKKDISLFPGGMLVQDVDKYNITKIN